MLGFSQAIGTSYGYTYGNGSEVIWLSQVHCQGNETNITDCSFLGWGLNDCLHYNDVHVICDSESIK